MANHPSQSKYWSNGEEVTHLDLGGAGPGAHIIMRRDLQKMMVDSLPPEVIFMGHKLESITEDDKEQGVANRGQKVFVFLCWEAKDLMSKILEFAQPKMADGYVGQGKYTIKIN